MDQTTLLETYAVTMHFNFIVHYYKMFNFVHVFCCHVYRFVAVSFLWFYLRVTLLFSLFFC